MYKIVKIKYKSIMINGDDKNSVDMNVSGTIHDQGNQTTIYFESKEKVPFEICFSKDSLTLKQGSSILHFKLNERIRNEYEILYGSLIVHTDLQLLQQIDNRLKIKYELYQDEACIAKIYMQVSWFHSL